MLGFHLLVAASFPLPAAVASDEIAVPLSALASVSGYSCEAAVGTANVTATAGSEVGAAMMEFAAESGAQESVAA